VTVPVENTPYIYSCQAVKKFYLVPSMLATTIRQGLFLEQAKVENGFLSRMNFKTEPVA
jgi:hypothetical protein